MAAITVTVGGTCFSATLQDSGTTRALLDRMPLELTMRELNGNEKYCYLDRPLPARDFCPGQIRAGDLMLFGADCLVLFYESFSTGYTYTPLGRLDDPRGLADVLGRGGVRVRLDRQ